MKPQQPPRVGSLMAEDGDDAAFAGDKKVPMTSFLAKPERRFIDWIVPRFPRFIEGWHLTLATLPISAAIIWAGWQASESTDQWLWLISGMVVLQWFTDSIDGSLGKYRDFGIPRWGFFMDHLLDFVFMCSVLVAWSFLLDGWSERLMLWLVPVYGTFMVSSFLGYGATQEFKITFLGVGPTETRIGFVGLNTALIVWGTGFIEAALPWVLGGSTLLLAFLVSRTSTYIWRMDMAEKAARLAAEAPAEADE